jgi:hypothetical protein
VRSDAGRGSVGSPSPSGSASPWWELGAGCCWRWRSWSAPCCWSTSTAMATATATTRPVRSPPRLDLLHDRHAEHDRVRRHRAGDRHARLINAFVITPLRIAFLVLLIGTTLEVLASQGREMFRVARWRKHMGPHVVVVGYGTKGRSAVETLVNNGRTASRSSSSTRARPALEDAHADGLAVVTGDATRREVLRRAGVENEPPGHHHHRPRRLQRAGHAHRAPAQPRRLHRRVGPRAGERRR